MAADYWCVAHLDRPATIAGHFLALAGFTSYCPLLRERHVRRGQISERIVPLFPRYLFVWIEGGRWCGARWSIGVAALIANADGPLPVPSDVVDGIKRREKNGAVELPRRELRTGDRVKILKAPLVGQIGLFAGMSGLERCAVLLNGLGGSRVVLRVTDVELAR
jgi:transcriptional antiterminator RfaH